MKTTNPGKLLSIAVGLTLAAGCGTMLKNLKQQNSEWADDAPPPPMVTRGEAVIGFLPLARSPGRFRTWRVEGDGGLVIPETAQLIDAYPVIGEWDHSRNEAGAVIGRVGYMAVLYREGETCTWVRGRYFETHLGNGSFGALELADFDKYRANNNLVEPARVERRHHFDCAARAEPSAN